MLDDVIAHFGFDRLTLQDRDAIWRTWHALDAWRDFPAARACGYKNAFVKRPTEWGPPGPPDPVPCPVHDIVVDDFAELADRLGA